jgi:hypothetical protein
MGKQDDLFGGWHSSIVESLHAGHGTGQCWNPTKIILALRQLVRWQSPKTLRKYKTTLFCQSCHTRCPVVDAYPNGECKLSCGCRRKVSTITEREYADLVVRAQALKAEEA